MMQQEKKDELLIFLQRQLVIEPHFPFLHSQVAVLLHTLESQDTKQIEHHLSTAITLAHRANNAQATAGFYIHYGAFYASR